MTTLRLALLPLFALAASAVAAPNPPTPPPPPPSNNDRPATTTCDTSGAVALEVDHDAVAGAKLPTSQLKIYDTGGWTFAETLGDGKPGRQLNGCFAKADLDKLKAVEAAPWQVQHHQVHCMAMSQTSTAFRLKGKPDYVSRTCGDPMDDKTAAALADVQKVADAAVQAASPSQTPPCCKH